MVNDNIFKNNSIIFNNNTKLSILLPTLSFLQSFQKATACQSLKTKSWVGDTTRLM